MKLPDFSTDVKLNRLRQQMGAELIPWTSGIDGMLVTTGIEISPDEIVYAPDGTLEYEGRKVVVYIRDQNVLNSYELVDPDPEQLRKFHVANCLTLKQMRAQSRYGRYVVATRTDGKFIVNFLVNNRIHKKGERVERRLYVCKHCLNKLDYKRYRNRRTQQDEIRESFDLNEFFEMYGSRIAIEPPDTDRTAPINKYSSNWRQISRHYRKKVGWRCEECGTDLGEGKKFLEVHHINSVKYDNKDENLRALCIHCHAEQYQHQRMKSLPEYDQYTRWRDNRGLKRINQLKT